MGFENDYLQKQENGTRDILELRFEPESDNKEFIQATEEYREIWEKDGQRILRVLEDLTSLEFQESRINVEIFEGISFAGRGDIPMKLRASYPREVKKGTLVHELSHRLLAGNGIVSLTNEGKMDDLGLHKQIDLFLYDALCKLYGQEFADKQVEYEKNLQPFYRQAWEWALKMTPEERAAELKSLVD